MSIRLIYALFYLIIYTKLLFNKYTYSDMVESTEMYTQLDNKLNAHLQNGANIK